MMHNMNPWPSLAPWGKTLSIPGVFGGELFYYDSGGGADKPTVILIHGLGDEADSWRHIFPLLSGAGYRVIAPDLPGSGRSRWKGGISLRGHCRTVMRLMTMTGAADTEKPAVIAGSSLGAGIAEMIAGKRPNLVKSLILLDGCFPFPCKIDRGLFLLGLPFIGRGWYRSFRSNHEAAWKSLYSYYGNLDGMSEADREFLRERVIARVESPGQERGYFATLRSMNAFLLFGQRSATRTIRAFPGKILVLWGEKDRVFPLKRAALFRSLRPDADFVLIAGAGHLPHQEKPDASAAEMLRFLQGE
ncbi:MAG: alpha/beta hydrolase [Treponema sp.]|jgi:pimeloyl-ACP methyl ester carboxylesterase|nr:alpha/beta hydrolase [Treponema sp.]